MKLCSLCLRSRQRLRGAIPSISRAASCGSGSQTHRSRAEGTQQPQPQLHDRRSVQPFGHRQVARAKVAAIGKWAKSGPRTTTGTTHLAVVAADLAHHGPEQHGLETLAATQTAHGPCQVEICQALLADCLCLRRPPLCFLCRTACPGGNKQAMGQLEPTAESPGVLPPVSQPAEALAEGNVV